MESGTTLDLTENKEYLLKVIQKIKEDHAKHLKSASSNILFDDVDNKREKLLIVISMCKIPEIPEDGKTKPITLKASLPHSYIDEVSDVLLISRDLKGHIKKSRPYDRSLQHFKDLLKEHNASHLISQVMPLKQLRNDYLEPEAKKLLADRFDYILCDSSVMKRVPAFLGKAFYGNNKKPVQVDLKSNKLAKAINNALSKCNINISLNGPTVSGQFGRVDQSDEHLVDNLFEVVKTLKTRIPGGRINIRSLHAACKNNSIPIYRNTVHSKHIGEIKHPNIKSERNFKGHLNTLTGCQSMISVTGTTVNVVKIGTDIERALNIKKKIRNSLGLKYCPKTNKLGPKKIKRLQRKLKKINAKSERKAQSEIKATS